MSGILERLEQKLDQLLALQVAPAHQPQPSMGLMPSQPEQGVTVTQPVVAQPDPLAFTAAAAQPAVQPQTVTNDMITSLVQPHLNNPTIKAAMQNVLAQMNIPGLSAAREDQYPALYAAFQQIITLSTAQQPANAGNSAMPATDPASVGGMSIL